MRFSTLLFDRLKSRYYSLIMFLDLYLSCNAQVVFIEWRSLCSFDLLLRELFVCADLESNFSNATSLSI
jgi:hypothetical protein